MKNTEKNEAAANPSRLDIVIIGSGHLRHFGSDHGNHPK